MHALLIATVLTGVLKTIHVFVSIFLIIVILLQPGKGDGMGALGGGGASSVFGASGSATFLSKVTSGCAIVFMFTSLSLSYLASRTESVALQKARAQASAPAAPAPAAPAPSAAPTGSAAPAAAAPAAPSPAGK